MKFRLILISYLLISLKLHAQEKQVKIDSKISEVIVFLSGAQVQRQSVVTDIPAGTSQLVFSALSPDIESQSIQVKGEGAFTILSVTKQSNFLEEQRSNEERLKLEQAIAGQKEKIELERNLLAVLKTEEEILQKNQEIGTTNSGLDLAKLKLALDFHRQRLTEIKNGQLEHAKKISGLEKELSRQQQQLTELSGKAKTNTSDIVVKVSAKTVVKGSLTVSYLVKNSSWYPTYDLRAKDVVSPMELVYKANVTQQSGEDWKNVKLILSSGNPTTSGNKPELRPYYVGFNPSAGYDAPLSITSVRGKMVDANTGSVIIGGSITVKGTSIGTTTDVNGNYSLQIPSGQQTLRFAYIGYEPQEIPVRSSEINVRMRASSPQLNELVIRGLQGKVAGMQMDEYSLSQATSLLKTTSELKVESQQTQTSIQFAIQDAYTILSDGKQFTVDIGQYQLAATYEYYAAPKISPDAFLTAKITSFSDLNLLSGEANVFFEGTFLGKSLVDVGNSSDTLNISLGTDKNIVIKRERQKDFNDRQFLGSNQRVTRNFIIDIKNRKLQPVNLLIEDQIPVSNSSDVTVEKQELSGAKLDETTGKLTWKFILQPNDQKKVEIRYQVRYPKNKNLVIE